MDWTLTRRILLVAFFALDVFLVVLIQQNRANSALPGGTVTLPHIGAAAVKDPLPIGDNTLPTISLRPYTAKEALMAVFGRVPAGRETAAGTVYQSSGIKVVAAPSGRVDVSMSLPPEQNVSTPQGAEMAASDLFAVLETPTLGNATAVKSGKGFVLTYGQTAAGVPLFGASATVRISPGKDARFSLRLYHTSRAVTSQSILSADDAVTYFVAAGGSAGIRQVALGYPTPARVQPEAQVAPVWRISTPQNVINVNAYTGENLP